MLLNEEYYRALWDKFRKVQTIKTSNDNVVQLTTQLILEHYRTNKPIHVNFQSSKERADEISEYLFVEFANDIYINHYDLPNLTKGSRLRDKRKYSDGKRHDYLIKSIVGNDLFVLEHTKSKAQLNLRYDDLVTKFIPIEQRTKQATLQNYNEFFAEINGDLKIDFTPTHFERKIVFIGKKALWDSLAEKNRIPSTYLPSPRDENNISEIRSIPALHDCIVYFTPKYEVCHQKLIKQLQKRSIKAIVVFDNDPAMIEQILQDRSRYGFNLIVISNHHSAVRSATVPCWDWFKEEMEILIAL